MSIIRSYWPWIVGVVGLLAVVAVICRERVSRLARLGKALATDKRLPRPVRALFAISLAIKVVPFPDFGIDEIFLLIGILLLAGPYRHVWRAIREETRMAAPISESQRLTEQIEG